MGYETYRIADLIDEIAMGPFGSNIKVSCFVDSGVPVLNGSNLEGFSLSEKTFRYVTRKKADSLNKANAHRGDIVITHRGTLGQIVFIPQDSKYDRYVISQSQFRVRCNDKVLPEYLVYYFHTPIGQHKLLSNASQVGVPALARPSSTFQQIEVVLPELSIQKCVVEIISTIQKKIVNNQELNDNLEQQAFTIFNNMFPNVSTGNNLIGDLITPQRGKNLLSKDAIPGKIPVVAGGLEPATYHNQSNTVPPVLTISSSGANAGFVNLWNIPVWSSDSSFIDSDMTDDVYFWYVMLKIRQQEIFDAQTGSAQPHIYPKHIAAMPVIDLNPDNITAFNNIVTPLFQTIGKNKQENIKLAEIRDTLLPKLMSGELDISSINL